MPISNRCYRPATAPRPLCDCLLCLVSCASCRLIARIRMCVIVANIKSCIDFPDVAHAVHLDFVNQVQFRRYERAIVIDVLWRRFAYRAVTIPQHTQKPTGSCACKPIRDTNIHTRHTHVVVRRTCVFVAHRLSVSAPPTHRHHGGGLRLCLRVYGACTFGNRVRDNDDDDTIHRVQYHISKVFTYCILLRPCLFCAEICGEFEGTAAHVSRRVQPGGTVWRGSRQQQLNGSAALHIHLQHVAVSICIDFYLYVYDQCDTKLQSPIPASAHPKPIPPPKPPPLTIPPPSTPPPPPPPVKMATITTAQPPPPPSTAHRPRNSPFSSPKFAAASNVHRARPRRPSSTRSAFAIRCPAGR